MKTHGGSRSGMYRRWSAMRARCTNENVSSFKYYGAKGIRVCERWNDFALFLEDVGYPPGPGYSLDRIDSNGDYEPCNIRWATAKEQSSNRSSARLLTHNGATLSLTEWAKRTEISVWTLTHRLDKLGWKVSDALTRPLRPDRRRSTSTFSVTRQSPVTARVRGNFATAT